MQKTILNHLNMKTLSKKGDDYIIWLTHDKDYNYGWYYLLKKDKLLLVYQSETVYEEHLIKDFSND